MRPYARFVYPYPSPKTRRNLVSAATPRLRLSANRKTLEANQLTLLAPRRFETAATRPSLLSAEKFDRNPTGIIFTVSRSNWTLRTGAARAPVVTSPFYRRCAGSVVAEDRAVQMVTLTCGMSCPHNCSKYRLH
jgi:hypothetical protein